jgi:hypothetical protein
MAIQGIRRAKTVPSVSKEAEEWFRSFLLSDYLQLAQQVNAVHTAFQAFQLAVAGAATTKAVTFTFPYADTNYSMAAMTDWNTTIFFSVKAVGGFTLNFGTASPGGGGNVTVMTMR